MEQTKRGIKRLNFRTYNESGDFTSISPTTSTPKKVPRASVNPDAKPSVQATSIPKSDTKDSSPKKIIGFLFSGKGATPDRITTDMINEHIHPVYEGDQVGSDTKDYIFTEVEPGVYVRGIPKHIPSKAGKGKVSPPKKGKISPKISSTPKSVPELSSEKKIPTWRDVIKVDEITTVTPGEASTPVEVKESPSATPSSATPSSATPSSPRTASPDTTALETTALGTAELITVGSEENLIEKRRNSLVKKELLSNSISDETTSPSSSPDVTLPPVASPDQEKQNKSDYKVRKRKLVIFDIDGLLVDRDYNPSIKHFNSVDYDNGKSDSFTIPKFTITPRPNLLEFWDRVFALSNDETSFFFGIWSSSNKYTFEPVLKKIIPEEYTNKFLFIWDRNMCELDPDYGTDEGKALKLEEHSTVKKLNTILNSATVNKMRSWKWNDEVKNVLIIDNDAVKLRFNPKESSYVFSEFEDDIMKVLQHPFFEQEIF